MTDVYESLGYFSGGKWQPARGEPFASLDPATGEKLWRGSACTEQDVAEAVDSAAGALPAWRATGFESRCERVRAFARQLCEARSELSRAIAQECGKTLAEAEAEVGAMIGKVEISIEAFQYRCRELDSGGVRTRFRPHGVVAVLGPFNFPGHLPNGHIVPALLAGNTVVFKPSELTPLVAERTIELWRHGGLPPGVINLVQGARSTGSALVQHGKIAGVFFTGSARTGQALSASLAGTGKILALEMGGNNPLVVWDTAHVKEAALLVVMSAFATSGQRCTCARRLIISDGTEGDAVLAEVLALTRRLRIGRFDTEPPPFMGPIISAAAAESLLGAQRALVARGGRSLLEMRLLRPGTGLLSPGILDVSDLADLPDEEHFGPLLQVQRVADFPSALSMANGTRYGLAAGLISERADLWEAFQGEARAGIVNWNQPLTGASSRAPFGGIGLSGNYRPSAYFAADYCSYPVASTATPTLDETATLPPGINPA